VGKGKRRAGGRCKGLVMKVVRRCVGTRESSARQRYEGFRQ
jgi:hypothetical protein